nr:hypothetical protein GCM10020185_29660 [Pseudomonas brassicacearum subsp. brassicacearum]
MVLNSYDVLGPNSPTVLFATEKFRDEKPENLQGIRRGADRSGRIRSEGQRRGGGHLPAGNQGQDRPGDVAEDHRQPADRIYRQPEKNTYPLAEFLYRVGAIKNKPASWEDYFFQDAKPLQGS